MIDTIEKYLSRYNYTVKELMSDVELQKSKESNHSVDTYINQCIDLCIEKTNILEGVVTGYNFLADKKVQLEKIEVLGSREDVFRSRIVVEEICTYTLIDEVPRLY